MKYWYNVKEQPPYEGSPLLILMQNGEKDTDFWTTDIAYYCDGGWYKLDYDKNLGILRKVFVTEPVEYWAKYMEPDFSDR